MKNEKLIKKLMDELSNPENKTEEAFMKEIVKQLKDYPI